MKKLDNKFTNEIKRLFKLIICNDRYLPPYTSFLPVKKDGKNGGGNSDQRRKNRRGVLVENIILSQLSYLTIFIIMICVTESKQLKHDPLNFNVLNIVIEVIR